MASFEVRPTCPDHIQEVKMGQIVRAIKDFQYIPVKTYFNEWFYIKTELSAIFLSKMDQYAIFFVCLL